VRVPGPIGDTGQSLRAWVAVAAMSCGMVASLLVYTSWVKLPFPLSDDAALLNRVVGTLLMIAALLLACFGIRCPACGCKWILSAMKTQRKAVAR